MYKPLYVHCYIPAFDRPLGSAFDSLIFYRVSSVLMQILIVIDVKVGTHLRGTLAHAIPLA